MGRQSGFQMSILLGFSKTFSYYYFVKLFNSIEHENKKRCLTIIAIISFDQKILFKILQSSFNFFFPRFLFIIFHIVEKKWVFIFPIPPCISTRPSSRRML